MRNTESFVSTNQQDWCIGFGSAPKTLSQPLSLVYIGLCQTRERVILANRSVDKKNLKRQIITTKSLIYHSEQQIYYYHRNN